MASFVGRVAIVTGGASGIGKAIGEEIARRGARVVLADPAYLDLLSRVSSEGTAVERIYRLGPGEEELGLPRGILVGGGVAQERTTAAGQGLYGGGTRWWGGDPQARIRAGRRCGDKADPAGWRGWRGGM